ncbi:MAG: protein kinase domain-containing protein [Myxococcota bacterium]
MADTATTPSMGLGSADPLLPPGQYVETFRITSLVAEGAMGQVYAAVDEQLGRRVALKFVKFGSLDVRALQRFRDEARTTARFSHPNIVTVYSAGVFHGRPWLALEFLDGETLRERFDEGPASPAEAMRIARAIAEALAEAHRHEVVHADLKPENVLIPRDGRVRVVDFGLSRLAGGEATNGSGTPAYMAPERWTGGTPQPSMDVWALGVILHEAIEGVRPFSDVELVHMAFGPRPAVLGPKVAASPCAAIVAACLAIDPAERPSAADVVQRLDRLLLGRDGAEGRSPFRGLDPFSEADAADFHGRADEIDAALERVRADALVPVVGPSGVGKSSFVFAGVVPRLKEQGWRVISLRPGRRPWVSLANALGCPVESLSAGPAGLITALRALGPSRVLLVIDQFEELITLGDVDDRAAVLAALAIAANADEPWRLMVTLRSDFLGEFAARPELASALRSVLVLRPLGRAALEAAVRGPLSRVGFECDDASLPARIASELEGQAAALPLLQFACHALWERRDAQRKLVLRREYEAMGGAVGALATHAQRLVSEQLPEERRLTRALVLRLVNADGTRKPRTRAELLDRLPEAAGQLDRLLSQRLVVSDRVSDDDEPLVELAHESLVTTWPQLTRWLAETQEARTLVQDVEQAAVLWNKRGRRAEETWAAEALEDVLRRVERWNVSLTSTMKEFLEAGRARHERLRRRRRTGLVAAFVALGLVATGALFAALAFREKERQAIAQQEQIRLAAGDVGRFELVLEPFDWDPVALKAVPVSADRLPDLDWRLHTLFREHPREPGPVIDSSRLSRSQRRVEGDGLHEIVEVGSAGAVFEFVGRGAGCGSAWVTFQVLPGFAARREPPEVVRVPVPTCQATRADAVSLGGFFLDRTEATSEMWEVYERLVRFTADERLYLPPDFQIKGAGIPVTGINAFTAERLCRFFGRRLPTSAEWLRAAQTHPQLTGVSVSGCKANLDGAVDGFEVFAPVGACTGDRTTEGVVDLQGNLGEWCADDEPSVGEDPRYAGLRRKMGADWGIPSGAPPTRLTEFNAPATRVDYATGVRCASE